MSVVVDKELYVLLFFKHKTSYGMRISDWSSDVCSSDLAGAAQSLRISGDGDGRAYVTTTLRYSTPPPTTPIEAGLTVTRRYFVRRDNQWPPLTGALMTVKQGEQNGRASSRERVCRYV